MGEGKPSESLEGLDARLKQARAAQKSPATGSALGPPSLGGFGLAFRIGVELVSALAVGVGIGWLLDRWLGTGPWLLVVFFFLGAGAGVLNVYRATRDMGSATEPTGRADERNDQGRG